MKKIFKEKSKVVLQWGGLALIILTLYFFTTGIDEIIKDKEIWFYGLGISGLLFTTGLISIYLSRLHQSKKILLILFVFFVLSIFLILFSLVF